MSVKKTIVLALFCGLLWGAHTPAALASAKGAKASGSTGEQVLTPWKDWFAKSLGLDGAGEEQDPLNEDAEDEEKDASGDAGLSAAATEYIIL